jgi:AraC family transcriptional regulator
MFASPSTRTTILADRDARRQGAGETAKGGLAPWQLREAVRYVELHLCEPIALASLAERVGLSRYHFCRAFKRSLGLPPRHYQRRRRIEHAMRLLAQSAASVTDIGVAIGYRETSSFTAAFHQLTGLTPTAYRRTSAEECTATGT